jgi:hypothetical protein
MEWLGWNAWMECLNGMLKWNGLDGMLGWNA